MDGSRVCVLLWLVAKPQQVHDLPVFFFFFFFSGVAAAVAGCGVAGGGGMDVTCDMHVTCDM
jgi:hypothetical protein